MISVKEVWMDEPFLNYILISNVSYSGKHVDSGFFATEVGQTEGTFDLGKRDQEAEIQAFTVEFAEELARLRETFGEDAVKVLFDVALYSY